MGNSKASSGVTLGNCFIMTKVGYSLEIKIDRCYCQWWWESIELLAECFLFFIRIYRIYIIYRKHTGGSERSLICNKLIPSMLKCSLATILSNLHSSTWVHFKCKKTYQFIVLKLRVISTYNDIIIYHVSIAKFAHDNKS